MSDTIQGYLSGVEIGNQYYLAEVTGEALILYPFSFNHVGYEQSIVYPHNDYSLQSIDKNNLILTQNSNFYLIKLNEDGTIMPGFDYNNPMLIASDCDQLFSKSVGDEFLFYWRGENCWKVNKVKADHSLCYSEPAVLFGYNYSNYFFFHSNGLYGLKNQNDSFDVNRLVFGSDSLCTEWTVTYQNNLYIEPINVVGEKMYFYGLTSQSDFFKLHCIDENGTKIYGETGKTLLFRFNPNYMFYLTMNGDNEEALLLMVKSNNFATMMFEIDNEVIGNQDHSVPTQENTISIYPNPFNPSTTISFENAKSQSVEVKIYNIKGQCVKTLEKGVFEAGKHKIVWQGDNDQKQKLGSGVYFCKIETPQGRTVKKMMLMK